MKKLYLILLTVLNFVWLATNGQMIIYPDSVHFGRASGGNGQKSLAIGSSMAKGSSSLAVGGQL